MNLDDLIVPNSVSSPAGLSRSPSTDPLRGGQAHSIPIKKRGELKEQELHLARASAPTHPPVSNGRNSEFGDIPRRVRKTSVDERTVSPKNDIAASPSLTRYSPENGLQKTHLRSIL